MQMDALHCGYPHASAGMDGGVPITPPATPTQEMSRTPTFSSLSSCSESNYSRHEYAPTEYADSQYSRYSTEEYTPPQSLSPPESPMTTPKSTPTHTPTFSDMNANPSGTSTTSASSSHAFKKPSSKTNRNRKNSFVYDVRLTDEQFLFFVPDFDLVKSHLMFAVREEVEVLKEKISELMERINQLEYENTVLRQYATQEALQQLQQPHHSSNT
ncbi:TSC22 domain family protein 2-like [Palaemon carinicauda]|uniref:TSC22 domain family protein 2-like n=1 Tax=Palaemon carinicauda TaxID=392227 RepID=UPI0035B64B46